MDFVKVASTEDLPKGKMIGAEIYGETVLVVNISDKYYAIGGTCTHKGCNLSEGILKGQKVQCPCHGSVFDVKTGKIVNGPAKKPELVYQTKVDGKDIMVKRQDL